MATNGKQSTLGKFWQLPKGAAAPIAPRSKDQPSLEGMWSKKDAAGQAQAAAEPEASGSGEVKGDQQVDQDSMDVGAGKAEQPAAANGDEKPKVEEEDEDVMDEDEKPGLPIKVTPTSTTAIATASSAKKRRAIVSDDEDDAAAGPSTSSNKKPKIASSPQQSQDEDVAMPSDNDAGADSDPPKPSSSKAKAKSKTKPAADTNPFSMAKAKSGKGKVVDPDEDENEDDEEDERKAGAKEEDQDEDEEMSDEEERKDDKAVANKLAMTLAQESKSISTAKWKATEPVPYSALTDTFDLIDKTTKRNQISSYLTHFLLQVAKAPGKDGGDLLRVVYLCINRLCPDYMGLELGMGESLIMKAIAQTTGRSLAQIKTDLRKVGDLGLVAEQSRGKQKTLFMSSRLTVQTVFKTFKDIAQVSGKDSQTRKVGLVCKLLTPCLGSETRFIIRSCEGKLRIGLAEKTLVTALAHAIVLKEIDGKNLSSGQIADRLARGAEIVKAVYSELPNYDMIVPALLKGGIDKLRDTCKLSPGVPLKPMLAKPTKAIGEVLDRFEGKEFTCEYKYDGERAQIHLLENGQIVVFSRNSENMSAKYPDLVESIPKCINKNVKSFVIDSEAVAYDLQEKKLLPFQDLTRRKRKDVRTEDITVRVHIFAFDLLYLNGEPLLDKDLKERRRILRENFHPVEGEFGFAISSDGSSSEQIAEFLDESIKDGCEGLMVKRLTGEDATYEPSRRSINWLKLKKDYLSGVGDSCDLVVVGAYYGKGKRTNVYGAFLLACYDPDSETFQTACKIGTGFSEQQLAELYDKLKPLETIAKRGDISADPSKPPDVWFEPQVLFEVLTADLTLSPIYMAGKGIVEARGISLRFPRFIRLRDDKAADDATTSDAIAEFYQAQATAHKPGGGGGDDY